MRAGMVFAEGLKSEQRPRTKCPKQCRELRERCNAEYNFTRWAKLYVPAEIVAKLFNNMDKVYKCTNVKIYF